MRQRLVTSNGFGGHCVVHIRARRQAVGKKCMSLIRKLGIITIEVSDSSTIIIDFIALHTMQS